MIFFCLPEKVEEAIAIAMARQRRPVAVKPTGINMETNFQPDDHFTSSHMFMNSVIFLSEL